MNTDLMQFMQMMRNGGNPQALVMEMLSRQANNPMFANLMQLAKDGKQGEIEAIVRNVMAEKGLDFDKEFNSFRRTMGL